MVFELQDPSNSNSAKTYTYIVPKSDAASYSSAVNGEFPKKDQALIIDCSKDFKLNDYVRAIVNTITVDKIATAQDIKYASRISNNRVCIYFSSKEIVLKLVDKRQSITIADTEVNIRPMIAKTKRVVFAHVPPLLPHKILMDILDDLKVKRCSPIITLHASVVGDDVAHVGSSRRQVYINPEDTNKLPPVINIEFEDTMYHIFTSTDGIRCFKCKALGHVARACPIDLENSHESLRNNAFPSLSSATNQVKEQYHSTLTNGPSDEEEEEEQKKRAHSSTTSGSKTDTIPHEFNKPQRPKTTTPNKETRKKRKLENPTTTNNIAELLEPAKTIFESDNFPISYEGMIEFLTLSRGHSKVEELALQYASSLEVLGRALGEIKDKITCNNLKSRIYRIRKKFTLISNNDNFDSAMEYSDSNTSTASQENAN